MRGRCQQRSIRYLLHYYTKNRRQWRLRRWTERKTIVFTQHSTHTVLGYWPINPKYSSFLLKMPSGSGVSTPPPPRIMCEKKNGTKTDNRNFLRLKNLRLSLKNLRLSVSFFPFLFLPVIVLVIEGGQHI